MTNLPPTNARRLEEIAGSIQEAWESGREIVPVVGAGLSADSGIPVVTSVVRYFGKLQQYIEHRRYLPPDWRKDRDLETLAGEKILKLTNGYREDPRKFIQAFRWPDRFQLNQDLLDGGGAAEGTVEASVREGLNAVLKELNPHGLKSFENLRDALLGVRGDPKREDKPGILEWDGATGEDEKKRFIDGLDVTLDSRISKLVDAKTEGIVRQVLGGFREMVKARLDSAWSNSVPFDLVGDWKKLIQHFTRFQGDYADALFARLMAGRQPSQGHRYLAFLVKLLGIRTIFTYNFDDLIERSLETEGIRPEVFAMEGGTALPHRTLLQDTIAVIKLHGSNHALLLDERLDHPVTDDYRERFQQIAGKNPLLLVVGCSGNDYRLRNLVGHFLDRNPRATGPSVVWLHYETDAPDFLKGKVARDKNLSVAGLKTAVQTATSPGIPTSNSGETPQESVYTRITNNPGATLLHIHSRLRACNPASRTPYATHIQRPISLDKVAARNLEAVHPKLIRKPSRCYLFDGNSGYDNPSDEEVIRYPVPSASQALIEFATYWMREGYHTIWVDLESVHTLAGVVGSIIDQCRAYDPSLPPSVLPLEEGAGPEVERSRLASRHIAVERVVHALRRTRYLVVLDGLETYVWPATAHHGITFRCQGQAGDRLKDLHAFLTALADRREELGESFLCVGVDVFKSRHRRNVLQGKIKLREIIEDLKKSQQPREVVPQQPWEVVTLSESKKDFRWTDHLRMAEDTAAVPLLRVEDEAFKLAVQGARPRNPEEESEEQWAEKVDRSASLVFFVLSCFRRTRTLVAVRTLLGPLLGGPVQVDAVLATLADECPWAGVVRLEGGGYWFTRTVRDYVYEKNSHFTSKDSMKVCLSGSRKDSEEYRRAAFQLLLLAVAHQRISRHYFAETFVQSHDSFAFLEYTYHRLSSIRYLAKLSGLIRHALADTDGESREMILAGVRQGRHMFRKVWKSDFPDKLLAETFEGILATGYDPRSALEEVQGDIQERHRRDIHSLHRAWVRSQGVLRAQLPAEQLLNWCGDIVEDDLVFRCNSVVVDYDDKTDTPQCHPFNCVAGPPTGKVNPYAVNRHAERDVESFGRFLKDFRVRSLIERTDYDGAVRQRWSQLQDLFDGAPAPEGVKELVAAGDFPTIRWDRCRVVHCHYLLDVADCILRHFQEFKTRKSELRAGADYTLELLGQVEEHIATLEKSAGSSTHDHGTLADVAARLAQCVQLKDIPFEEVASLTGDLHEAYLRLHYLKSECLLGQVIVFSHDGFLGGSQEVESDREVGDLEKAEKEICEGLSRIRDQDLQTGQSPRSVMIDPTVDGSLYLQYRSCFNIQRGRARWRRAIASGQDPRTSGGFESALRDFELARGGLGGTNPLLGAVAEFSIVEVSLARARLTLHEAPVAAGDPISTARAHYETARGALQRARQDLLSGRRNVVWWKKFFQLVSQYHADRLLLGYMRWYRHWPEGNALSDELPMFLLRLRRGYDAIRSALDYFLPERSAESGSDAVRSPWLVRAWWEITLSSYATGILAAHKLLDKDQKDAHPLVSEYLQWLNKSATLVGHNKAVPDQTHYKFFGTMLDDLAGHGVDKDLSAPQPQADVGKLAFDRRQVVLKLAETFSTKYSPQDPRPCAEAR